MKRYLLVLAVVVISFITCTLKTLSQNPVQLENWQTYSSILNSVASDVDSKGRIWTASNGGVYNYNPADETFKEFRNIDAMLTLDATSIAALHKREEMYIGTFDGVLEIVTEDYKWTHITDIQKPNFPDRRILSIIFNGDLAYVGGSFGLTTFDINEHVFRQTPSRLGSFQPLTTVNGLHIADNILWAATDEGVAKIDLKTSIINPENWTNYTFAQGLPRQPINGITSFEGNIYCFSDTTVCQFQDTGFVQIKSTAIWDVVKSIGVFDNKFYIATLFNVRDLNDVMFYNFTSVLDTAYINGFSVNPINGSMNILLNDAGFVIKNSEQKHIKPVSPVSNLFTSLDIDINGNLWSATEYSGGKGFMRLKDGLWMNFTHRTTPQILTENYGRVSCFPDGRIVLSSWGVGYLTLTANGDDFDYHITNSTNSCLTGVNGAPNYVVTGETAYDPRNGSSWVINFAPNFTGNLFMGINAQNEQLCGYPLSTREFIPLAIDYSGTKWAGSTYGYGLAYFNEGNDWDSQIDDKWGLFTQSNSQLPSSTINCIAVDKGGVIWLGTPNGLAYILSPSNVLRDVSPIIKPTSIRVLQSLPINDIMVDALNNKWVATNSGVFVIDPDGIEELAQFTVDNSPLITNDVASLATNFSTGKVYFGTRLGLSEAQSFAIQPLESFDIKCYPQPYYPERDGHLTIEGLAENADIRILTTDGKLVKNITTFSQKATWDGLDDAGNKVASGVYLIMGTSLSTESKGVAKFAIIRN